MLYKSVFPQTSTGSAVTMHNHTHQSTVFTNVGYKKITRRDAIQNLVIQSQMSAGCNYFL